MSMMMIPIIVGAHEVFLKSLERGLEKLEIGGRIETIWTEKNPEELTRRVVDKRPSAYAGVKNLQATVVIMIIKKIKRKERKVPRTCLRAKKNYGTLRW